MRVIGIDPGYDRLGVAILEGDVHAQRLIFSTCITTNKKASIPERLHEAGALLADIVKEYAPARLGIETLFFNKNVKTALNVAEARGVILYVCQAHNVPVFEYSPQAIKIAVTGHGASGKEQVEDMLRRLVSNIPKTALDDEYDAIAAAVTCLVTERV
jgi:crossover junction endodeoxyribonuclease RuvC